MANKINFEVGFTTNSKGLQELKSELAEIRALANNDKGFGGDLSKIQAMVKSANDLEYAMTAAFDVDLNTVNIQKFNQILKQSKTDLSQIQQNLAYAGTAGQSAFLKATAGLMQFNTAAKQTNKFLDSIATSFANTIKWSAMSSIVNTISGTIQKSYYYVKDLDSALNDIRIVTGKNADEMSRFAEEANNAAKALAVTTEDYTQGSLIYYQQGLDDETVKTLTDITAKTSNVTGQSMSAVSEELTAVWNGYQVANEAAQEGMQVYEEYVDKMAAVGASTASDLQELSTAMSKVASAASSMGVGFDDLNAQIATIVSVTRQAPESVGTALKTIYARLGDLKVDGVDEFGVKLGEVSAQLKQMGIEVLDQNGNLRDMTPVMAEVAEKWNSWTEAQRQAAAVAMAGKRQYNNLIALFDNWDMYGDALKTSMEAAGTLEEQQEIALDSLSNKMDQLKATAEDLYDSLYDEEDIKGLVEGLTKVVQGIADFSDAIGGLKNLIPMLGSVAAGVFSNQIAKGLSTIVINAQNARKETQMMTDNYNQLKMMFSDSTLFSSVEDENMNSGAMKQGIEQLKEYYSTMQQYQGIMSEEQKETYNSVLNNIAKVGELNIEIEKSAQSLDKEQKSWKLIDTSLLENEKDLKGFSDQVQRTSKLATELGKALALSEGESKISRKEAYDVIYKIGKESKLSTEEIKQLKREFQNLANKTGDNNEAFKQFVEQLQKTGHSAEEIQKLVQEMRNLRDGTEEVGKSLKSNLDLQKFIGNISNAISAVGQLATSISTLKNIGNILNDENLDSSEKFLQTIMNLSFALPSLFNSLSKINSLLNTYVLSLYNGATATEIFAAKKKVANALIGTELTLTKERMASMSKEEIQEAIFVSLKNKEIIARGASTEAEIAEIEAEVAKTAAEKAEIIVTNQNIAAQSTLNAVLLANPYTIVIGAIVGLIAVMGALDKAQEKQLQNQIDSAKATVEQQKAIRQQIDTESELYESYINTYELYKENKTSKEDMLKATQDLCDVYDIEIDKLDLVANRYDKVTEAINKAQKSKVEEAYESAKIENDSATEALIKEASKYNDSPWDEYYTIAPTVSSKGQEGVFNVLKSQGVVKENEYGYGYDWLTRTGDMDNPEEYVKIYDKISEAMAKIRATLKPSEYLNSDAYNELKDYLAAMKDFVENYKASAEAMSKYNAQLSVFKVDISNIERLEEYKEKLQEVTKIIDETEHDWEKSSELAKNYLLKNNSQLSIYQDQLEIIENISKKTGLVKEEIEEWLEKLDPEQKKLVLSGEIEFDGVKTFEDAEEAIKIAQNKINEADLSVAVSFRGKLTSDKKLSKKDLEEMQGEESNLSQDYEVLLSNFDEESSIDKLDKINDIVHDKIRENREWIQDAKELAEQELEVEQKKLENLEKERKALEAKKVAAEHSGGGVQFTEEDKERLEELNSLTDELTTKIVNLQDIAENGLTPEEIDDTWFTSMIDGIDGVISKAELLKDLASSVGEDWKIAASGIEEFAQNFPDILAQQENYNTLQDGSIQLTEKGRKLLQAQLEDQKAKLIAENESYKQQLQQQAEIELAAAEYYEEQAQNLSDYLNGVKTGKEAEASMEKSLNDFKTKLMNQEGVDAAELSKVIQENQNKAKENSATNIKAMYDYWCCAGGAAAAYAQAAVSGKFEPPDWVDGGTGVVDTSTYSPKAEDPGEWINDQSIEDLEEMRKQYAEEAIKRRNRYAELISKKVSAESATKASVTAIENAASGVGNEKSKSSKSKSQKEHKDDEVNRYWEIEKALDKIADALKKVDKLKSHVFGKQKIQVLKQESELIKQQTQLYEKLYAEQKKEAEELKAKLSAGGAAFSAAGEVLNYGEALKGALAQYNKAVDDFNAGLIDDQAFKIAEDNYEKFKKDMDRYDKLFYSEMKDTREKIEEEAQKLRDIAIEEFEIKIQIKIDKAQLRKDFRNFRKELQKDFTLQYEVLPKIKDFRKDFKDDKSQVNTRIQEAKTIQKEIDLIMAGGTSKMYASLSEAQEALKKANEGLEEASRNAMQDVEDAWGNYIDMIDQANEKLTQQEERLERVNTQLESFRQIAEMAFGSKAYEQFGEIIKRQLDNNQAQIEMTLTEAKTYKDLFEKQIKIEGANRDDMSTWSAAATEYYKQWLDYEQKINDLTIDRLSLLKDNYSNTLDEINDDLEKQLTEITLLDENGQEVKVSVGFDIAEDEWELAEKQADLFYNSTEKAYQVQSLSNKIQKDIDKSSLANQKKLQAFRDKELDAMKNEKVLTKDQVAAAEAKYDILLKQIALEDARNNKTSMKLTRNAEGNWSYQYVADDSDIQQKQQDLLDSWENFRSLSEEQWKNAAKNLREYQKIAIEAYVENEKQYADGIINQEQYEYKKKMIYERYYSEPTGIIPVLESSYQESKNNLILGEIGVRQEVYDQDKDHYIKFTEEEKAILDGFREHTKGDFNAIETAVKGNYANIQTETENRMGEKGSTYVLWNTATTKMADAWTNNKTGVQAKVTKALDAMSNATIDYKNDVAATAKQAGLDWESMKTKIGDTKTETDLAKKAIIDYCKEINNKLPKAAQQVQNLKSAWEGLAGSITTASDEIEKYLQKEQELKNPSNSDDLGTSGNGYEDSNKYGTGNGNTNKGNLDKGKDTSTTTRTGALYLRQTGNGMYMKLNVQGSSSGYSFTDAGEERSLSGWNNSYSKTRFYLVPDTRKIYPFSTTNWNDYRIAGYKTGGYTGSWTDNNGRLAMLHQKELVLNAQDTENFLSATDTLRNLVSLDSSIEKSIANAISKMLVEMSHSAAGNITTSSNNESNTNNIFNINAEFPNANDVNEIREAILSLPTLASQHIHKNGY